MPDDADIPLHELMEQPPPNQQPQEQKPLIRLDPRDIQSIIEAVKADTPSTSQAPTTTHSFKREGFGRQFDFNSAIIRKLASLPKSTESNAIITEVIQDLTVRNETLKIADSHPQVFQFLDSKTKSDSLKSMDPRLSEFMDSVRKKEQESRKRKSSPTPFRGRETAWRPVSFVSRPPNNFTPSWDKSSSDRKPYYSRRDRASVTSPKKRKTEGDRHVIAVEERATGSRNVQITNSEFLPGSIHNFYLEWLALEPSKLVSTTSRPSQWNSGNRKSALMHKDFVTREIAELLSTGVIREVDSDPHDILHIHPLSVAKGKKLRLVLDLSHLNKFLHVPRVKFDDMSSVIDVLPEGGFMATFDLKAGYHHVRIEESHTNFLGFRWDGRNYKFLCLPFGLSSAPHIFTKLLRTFIKLWRAQGRGIAIYIDDGNVFERSREACAETVSIIRDDLKRAGWYFAEDKCHWNPSQTCEWLGFHINLSSMFISVAPERLSKARHRLEIISGLPSPSLHDRLRWAGTLSSLHVVLKMRDKRNTRAVCREIAAAQSQGWPLSKKWFKTNEERLELHYWAHELQNSPQLSLRPGVEDRAFSHIIDVDASEHSVGAVLRDSRGYAMSHTFRELPPKLIGESSTARELFAIHFALDTYKNSINQVLVHTDSQSAVAIYNKGSLGLDLHRLAANIWELERNCNILTLVRWIPRARNHTADWASRQIDYDDWRIADHIFRAISRKWGEPRCDMFANDRNARCEKFFSRYQCPGSSGTDAFEQVNAWRDGLLWLVPPINMITKTIKWAKIYGSRGILGCPLWESQPYYPTIRTGQSQWADFVVDSVIFPVGTKLFKDPQAPGAFGSEFSLSPFVFLLIDFGQQRFKEAAFLGVKAEQIGLPHVSQAIINAINADRAPSTIKVYTAEVQRFKAWKSSPHMRRIPLPQARNLYLAKCSAEGRHSSMPTVVAALNYFCGPLQGVDKEIQGSLLEAVKRTQPPPQHRTKIQPIHMAKIINVGLLDSDPKVIQAAALALIQFKGLLRISEAQNLRRSEVKHVGKGEWQVRINRSKTDQCSKGAVVAFRFSAREQALWSKYTASLGSASFLFQSGSTGSPLAISTLRDRLTHLLKKANLSYANITSHSFRGGGSHTSAQYGSSPSSCHAGWALEIIGRVSKLCGTDTSPHLYFPLVLTRSGSHVCI
ncbi:reverse transcriptase [Cooperia oncophora]